MASPVTTKTTDLGDSRVRVEVEVGTTAVEREVERTAGAIGRDLKIPGFRKGKVPPQVVVQRLGRQAVLDEAVRAALPRWYEDAVTSAGLATVGDPQVSLEELPGKGSPLTFSIEVGVRPEARLGDYEGLEVGRREATVPDEEVQAELERLRDSQASLESVERPAAPGDFVVVDFVGSIDGEAFEGGEARGALIELGSGRLVPGFEEQLAGAEAGEDREVRVTFPEDYATGRPGAEGLAGREAVFACQVKDVKEKRLPDLDDDFATDAAGFDTLDELRTDIRRRLEEAYEEEIEREFREAVVDAVADSSDIDIPKELVHARAHEMWHATAHGLERQGIDPKRYLEVTGKDEEALVHDAEPEAERGLKREAVLAAVAAAEGIEVTDAEVLDSLRAAATRAGRAAPGEDELERSLERAKKDGRDEPLRRDIAMRKAVDVLVGRAKPIPVERAKAREKLWTPGAEERAGEGRLWTPGT